MMTFEELERRVLRRVKPTLAVERRIGDAVARLERALRAEIARAGLKVEPVLVGSIAKGTHLADPDIDMFLLFPPDAPRAELEREGLRLAKAVMKGEERYAEHPYLHGEFGGFEADIVPSYKITSPDQRMTAVDRTPFHTAFVVGRISSPQRDEVRLLKRFMKGTGTYGAEARRSGFSGYLVELLVLKYGTFRGVLAATARWRPGVSLDLGVQGSRSFPEPLVFVDPVDGGRNVAAALSGRVMAQFSRAAADYLARPSERFFFPRERRPFPAKRTASIAKARGTDFVGFYFPVPELTDDTLYPQLRKCERSLRDLLAQYDFRPIDSDLHVEGGRATVVVELETAHLPGVLRHEGPPAGLPNAEEFVAKWRASRRRLSPPFLAGTRWYVDIPRRYTEPVKLIEENIQALDLGKNLNELIRGDHGVLGTRELLGKAHAGAMSALLDKRLPWEV
jgi:tRNA nucleotidyltransferase (CCA-adding enzyme)